jgi:hypothetical protein
MLRRVIALAAGAVVFCGTTLALAEDSGKDATAKTRSSAALTAAPADDHVISAAEDATVSALESGALAAGAETLSAMIAADPANADARFGLGMIRFVQAVEHLSQGLYRYGLQPPHSFLMPIVRLPVPENPDPEPIDYAKFRQVLLDFVADFGKAEETLAAMPAGVDTKLVVDLTAVRYDADGDGTVTAEERMTAVLARFLEIDPQDIDAEPLVVAFDTADAFWLRGYSHVLMALGEFMLAHDWHESFDASFHVFFPKAHSAFQNALSRQNSETFFGETGIADLISFLHIRWPVAEPERMAAVIAHLKAMVSLSRQDWAAIAAETDDDREWIPGPGQTGVTGATVTAEQVAAWHDVLDEVDALLDGKKLLPHWRFDKGINLRRVFEEPQPFDLVLWITGPAALPYLENGAILSGEEWARITNAFEDNFGSYAIWFN